MDARVMIDLLGIQPHPEEGGFFVETYRSPESTAIYYLLTPETVSAMHRLPGDEAFHHYGGDAVEMLLLHPDGRHEVVRLGGDLGAGERPQVVVGGGVWQGSVLVDGGAYALLGTTMAPPFRYEDYEHGDVEALAVSWPEVAAAIRRRARR